MPECLKPKYIQLDCIYPEHQLAVSSDTRQALLVLVATVRFGSKADSEGPQPNLPRLLRPKCEMIKAWNQAAQRCCPDRPKG